MAGGAVCHFLNVPSYRSAAKSRQRRPGSRLRNVYVMDGLPRWPPGLRLPSSCRHIIPLPRDPATRCSAEDFRSGRDQRSRATPSPSGRGLGKRGLFRSKALFQQQCWRPAPQLRPPHPGPLPEGEGAGYSSSRVTRARTSRLPTWLAGLTIAFLLHLLDQLGRAVIADRQMALDETRASLALTRHHGHRLVEQPLLPVGRHRRCRTGRTRPCRRHRRPQRLR